MSWYRCGSGGTAMPPMITCELVGTASGYYQSPAAVAYTATEDCMLIGGAGAATVSDKAMGAGISMYGSGTIIGRSTKGASQGPNTAGGCIVIKLKAGETCTVTMGGTGSTANSPYALVVYVIKNIPNLWDD